MVFGPYIAFQGHLVLEEVLYISLSEILFGPQAAWLSPCSRDLGGKRCATIVLIRTSPPYRFIAGCDEQQLQEGCGTGGTVGWAF